MVSYKPLEQRSQELVDQCVGAYMDNMCNTPDYTGFQTPLLRNVEYIRAEPEQNIVHYRFVVQKFMCNDDGNMHGGAATTIMDNLSSTALFTLPQAASWDNLGVSRSLVLTFHRPLPRYTVVDLRCRVIAAGKRMAQVEAVMVTAEGKVAVICAHDKVSKEVQAGAAKI